MKKSDLFRPINSFKHFSDNFQDLETVKTYPIYKNWVANMDKIRRSTVRRMTVFSGQTSLVVGAGPSLDASLPKIQSQCARHGWHVVATDTSLKALLSRDITPTAVVTRECDNQELTPGKPTSEKHLDALSHAEFTRLRTVTLYAATWANPMFVSRWPGPVQFFMDQSLRYSQFWRWFDDMPELVGGQQIILVPRSPCVGFVAIELLRFYRAAEAVLVGFDMGAPPGQAGHCTDYGMPLALQLSHAEVNAMYAEKLAYFMSHHMGDFGMKVINCSGRGNLTKALTGCEEGDLRSGS